MSKPLVDLHIDQENLLKASNQLWDLLWPYLDYLSPADRDYVRLAFDFMVEKHHDQRRKSGDFYILHTTCTAIILAQMEFNKETLAAGLMHDIPEDVCENPIDGIKLIQKEFGQEVAFLVNGITKLSAIKYIGETKQAENLRKIFVAMSQDLRVIFIKLADRLHNLWTLKSLRPDKAQRIALESLEIYAPIAERLGVGILRTQIEEAAFPFAYPADYRYFLNLPELNLSKREKQVKRLIGITKKQLEESQISYSGVFGRAKNYYSIFKKVSVRQKPLNEIYDLIALRVVTTTIANCYEILSILIKKFELVEGRIKDYIQMPKANGYQSIHLNVREPTTGIIFEFQIRTRQMHEYAEYGVAAHWWYKENIMGKSPDKWLSKENFTWIKNLIDLDLKRQSQDEYMKNVRLNVYPHRIFVFTPKSEVIDLPSGSTAIDFAYKIHESIGSHAIMAKINGKVTKLNELLKTGDTVEIVTSKNQQPSADWLNWTKNSSSAKKIRAFLRTIGVHINSNSDK